MPSLYRILFLLLGLFPLYRLQFRSTNSNNNLNANFVQWMNGLFYLPPDGQLRVRKEYRTLTDTERNDFHRALVMLKRDRSITPNKYDALASLHHLNTAAGAHGGPNFPGWHRVYLVLIENALREKVPNVTLPYWDNTLDANLPDPRLSITWSPLFLGSSRGVVRTGPFAGWNTPYGALRRNVGTDRRLMSSTDLGLILSRRWLWEITNPSASDQYNLELLHNHVHVYVGEQMSRIESASYDPAFFTHHTFIDCLWEEFRERQRARGINPGRDYPRIVGDNQHQPLVPMGLGRLLVIDGINDIFTRRIYKCEKRPTCVQGTNHCGSQYLRCNWSNRQCLPLIMGRSVAPQRTARPQWWQRNGIANQVFGK
ncbi:putative tyrosinase-like protein tyr-1 [Mytilus trossulus]|uniref:putative tyrosinase-like protein tyr-1 n=1 Tax=Mytilus trossulus TaxID=6551 RepID=UPI003006FABA